MPFQGNEVIKRCDSDTGLTHKRFLGPGQEVFKWNFWFEQQINNAHGIRRVDERKGAHMLFLKPLFTDRWISKRFRRYGSLRPKSFTGQRSNHLEGFLRSKIDGQVDIRRQSGMAMQ